METHWIKPLNLFADLECSVCGASGRWPYISFLERCEEISARPEDCAAIFLTDGFIDAQMETVNVLRDANPENIASEGFGYEAYCPRCYRFGETPEENGRNHSTYNGLTPDDVEQIFSVSIPLKPNELLPEASKRIVKDLCKESVIGEESSTTDNYSSATHYFKTSLPLDDPEYGFQQTPLHFTWIRVLFMREMDEDYATTDNLCVQVTTTFGRETDGKGEDMRFHDTLLNPRQRTMVQRLVHQFMGRLARDYSKATQEAAA